jgi:Ca2+-binding RTX toxin-like protein
MWNKVSQLMSQALGASAGPGRRHRERPGFRPGLEALEERANPSSYISPGGDLVIQGTNGDDTIYVLVTNDGSYYVAQNGDISIFPASWVTGGDVYVYGYQGNDVLDAQVGLRVNAYGMAGNDFLSGGWGDDYLDGGAGADGLRGQWGNDTLVAGYDYSYNDLAGGEGNDVLHGGYGPDDLYGEGGDDTLGGKAGVDYLDGMYGEGDHDVLVGGHDGATNYMDGGEGPDTITGALGVDYILGQGGDDYLDGYYGNDFLYGGDGDDHLEGGFGADYLDGGLDGIADYLEGGEGADRFEVEMAVVVVGRPNGGSYWVNIDAPHSYDPDNDGDQFVNYY